MKQKTLMSRFLSKFGILLGLILLIIIFTATSEYFFDLENFFSIFEQSSINLVIAIGMTFVIASGGIDLSVGSTVALSSIIMADMMINKGLPVVLCIFIAMFVGILVGIINGFFIGKLKLQPFIVTLSSMTFIRGFALMYSDGRPVYGMPEEFRQIFAGKVGIIPTMVLWAALVLLIAAIVLKKTKIGEYTLAIGGNEEAALVCGIRIKLYKIIVYSISGMLSAFASIMLSARLNAAEPIAGGSFELDAIAAVVMGGTALTGGKATIAGTVIAALTLGVLRNGLTLLNFQSYFQQVVIGVVILLAVILDKKRSEV